MPLRAITASNPVSVFMPYCRMAELQNRVTPAFPQFCCKTRALRTGGQISAGRNAGGFARSCFDYAVGPPYGQQRGHPVGPSSLASLNIAALRGMAASHHKQQSRRRLLAGDDVCPPLLARFCQGVAALGRMNNIGDQNSLAGAEPALTYRRLYTSMRRSAGYRLLTVSGRDRAVSSGQFRLKRCQLRATACTMSSGQRGRRSTVISRSPRSGRDG